MSAAVFRSTTVVRPPHYNSHEQHINSLLMRTPDGDPILPEHFGLLLGVKSAADKDPSAQAFFSFHTVKVLQRTIECDALEQHLCGLAGSWYRGSGGSSAGRRPHRPGEFEFMGARKFHPGLLRSRPPPPPPPPSSSVSQARPAPHAIAAAPGGSRQPTATIEELARRAAEGRRRRRPPPRPPGKAAWGPGAAAASSQRSESRKRMASAAARGVTYDEENKQQKWRHGEQPWR